MNNRIYQSPDLYSLLSNRLLTSVSALQTSLDILRKNRPDYTPRTGFVWPIVGEPEPSSTETKKGGKLDKGKSRAETEEPSTQSMGASDPSSSNAPTQPQESGGSKEVSQVVQATPAASGQKVQNTMLLMNAMRVAATQSKITLSPAAAALAAAETAGVGASAPGTAMVDGSVTVDTPTTTAEGALTSSATPAPGGQEAMIKGINPTAAPVEKVKKKKKKSVAAPTPSAS